MLKNLDGQILISAVTSIDISSICIHLRNKKKKKMWLS